MVYSYLLELYKVLDERKIQIEQHLSELKDLPEKFQYQQGRLMVLTDLKEFLTQHYHAKLPRRIQRLK